MICEMPQLTGRIVIYKSSGKAGSSHRRCYSAIAVARSVLSICVESATTVGSNSIVAAPIAVKCNVQMAVVSKPAARNFEVFRLKIDTQALLQGALNDQKQAQTLIGLGSGGGDSNPQLADYDSPRRLA